MTAQDVEIERLQGLLDHAVELMNDGTVGAGLVLADNERLRAEKERAERDCMDLHIALYEAITRLKQTGGQYDDLLAVLKRISIDA